MPQKSVSVYIGKKDSNISRAVEVLSRRSGITESDLFKECFKKYCESIRVYSPPEGDGKGRWNTSKIERLEKKYPPNNSKLNMEVIDEG